MFDIGWSEFLVIGVVALVVIGPKELPTVLRTMGQWMTKIRRMASEFQGQFQEAMREAEFSELKKQVDAIGDPLRDVENPLATARKEFEGAFKDTPAAEAAHEPVPELPPLTEPPVETATEPTEASAPLDITVPDVAPGDTPASATASAPDEIVVQDSEISLPHTHLGDEPAGAAQVEAPKEAPLAAPEGGRAA